MELLQVSSGAITGATNITASGATTTGTAVVGSDLSNKLSYIPTDSDALALASTGTAAGLEVWV